MRERPQEPMQASAWPWLKSPGNATDTAGMIRRVRLGVLAILAIAILVSAAVPASARGELARCTLLGVHKYGGGKVVARRQWIARVRVRNTSGRTVHVRGVWHVTSPHQQRFGVRARLKPGAREIGSAFLGAASRRPTVALDGCHARPA
jgi:hypothetical protein